MSYKAMGMEENTAIHLSIRCHLEGKLLEFYKLEMQNLKSCCLGDWPVLFDRSSQRWWDPRFDSKFLEQQFSETTLPLIR